MVWPEALLVLSVAGSTSSTNAFVAVSVAAPSSAKPQPWAELMTYEPLANAYATNFSVIDPAMWATDTSCFSCKAPKDPETVFECTNNTAGALRPGSIGDGVGLTIVTTRRSNAGACSPAPAGGTSGHLSSKQPFSFGTIRVKSRYFPGSVERVSTAKGFIGLEDPHSGAITITMHGVGGIASGAPPQANWTRYMQSSCYQHGNNHDKVFSDLGAAINAADDFNLYEIEWTPTTVTIRVNGNVARRVSDPANVPQKPLYVRLHARSTEYNGMAEGATFESFIEEFSFTPMRFLAGKSDDDNRSALEGGRQEMEAVAVRKGMCWGHGKTGFYNGLFDYSSTAANASLHALASTGTNAVQIETAWYVDDCAATVIHPAAYTPSDAALRSAIASAHGLGMETMLNAHLEVSCKYHVNCSAACCGRTCIDFGSDSDSWDAWFRSYTAYIVHHARL